MKPFKIDKTLFVIIFVVWIIICFIYEYNHQTNETITEMKNINDWGEKFSEKHWIENDFTLDLGTARPINNIQNQTDILNANLPIQLNEWITWVKISISGNIIYYDYELKTDFNKIDIDNFKRNSKIQYLKVIKEELVEIPENWKVIHRYKDINNKTIENEFTYNEIK